MQNTAISEECSTLHCICTNLPNGQNPPHQRVQRHEAHSSGGVTADRKCLVVKAEPEVQQRMRMGTPSTIMEGRDGGSQVVDP